MKQIISTLLLVALTLRVAHSQEAIRFSGAIVFQNNDVVFHQLDAHTWVGTGHKMWYESLYLIEGAEKAVLIDAGTDIPNLDKIIAQITTKPLTVLATHVHPDHTGMSLNCFPEVYINPADTSLIPLYMQSYKGKIQYLSNKQVFNLGGRQVDVLFTPGHTAGSTTFFDNAAGYGFSGDSFGSGYFLLFGTFSSFMASCQNISDYMKSNNIRQLYPGHFTGNNTETEAKIQKMLVLSQAIVAGKEQGHDNPDKKFGLQYAANGDGFIINYSSSALK